VRLPHVLLAAAERGRPIASGSHAAGERQLERTSPPAFSQPSGPRRGPRTGADDLTGEVFLQLVRHLDRFSGDERDFRAGRSRSRTTASSTSGGASPADL
jgi:hypothetical protein